MTGSDKSSKGTTLPRGPFAFGLLGFLGIAFFFLWSEHRAHLMGALPFLLLLLCPIIHLFMHHGHHHGGHSPDKAADKKGADKEKGGRP